MRLRIRVRSLVEGDARGPLLELEEPISFWGGVDSGTGRIVERGHPQHGLTVTGTILSLPHGRGSSSASSVLAEMIRSGTAPAAMVLASPDPILVLGAVVADELYGQRMPVVERLEDWDPPPPAGAVVQVNGKGWMEIR